MSPPIGVTTATLVQGVPRLLLHQLVFRVFLAVMLGLRHKGCFFFGADSPKPSFGAGTKPKKEQRALPPASQQVVLLIFCQNRIRFPAVDTYLKIAIVSIMGDA